MLLDRLIREEHILTNVTSALLTNVTSAPIGGQTIGLPVSLDAGVTLEGRGANAWVEEKHIVKNQRICLLAMCGIHLGPLTYLSGSLVGPYLQAGTSERRFGH
jgi:hypothetical protein